MYKMIIFDIDGTLMKYKETSLFFDDKIKLMFQELKDKGYIVALASGRDYISIGELHLTDNVDFFIGANGSFIYDTKLKKDIWNTKLSLTDFTLFKKEILDKNIEEINNIILSDNNNIFVYSYDQIKDHWFWKDFASKFKPLELHTSELSINNFHLITINCLNKNLIDLSREFFKKTNSSLDVQAFWSNGFFVSKKGLNKAKTIEKLAAHLKINIEEIIAFGDGENDIQMIKMVGMGIAMANGIVELKDVANDIAKDVEEYGTYYKLKELGII